MTTIHTARPVLPTDDQGLIQAHLEGVEGAFDELFRRYHPRLVTYLHHRVSDASAADDLAQETLIRAMHALERFDTSRPVWPWLRRIATNAAIDWGRARSRARTLTQTLAHEPALPVEGPDFGEREILLDALSAVPDRQRHALEKCYIEGWRPVDVAADFGVGSNAFEQLLHRARGNLRRAYLRNDRDGRAAGVIWLAMAAQPLLRPLLRATEAVRRLGPTGVRTAEVAIATLTVGAVVAIGGQTAPQPMAMSPEAAPRMPAVSVPALPDDLDAPSSAEGIAPVAETPPTAAAPVATVPSGAGRAAPAAVAAPQGPESPGTGPSTTQPTTLAPPAEANRPADPPQSAPEAIGGCGSLVRGVICDATGALSS